MFNVNFNDIAIKLIPSILKKTRILAIISSIFKPLKNLNIALVNFRNDINYKLQFNAQIIYLEHYLNDLYDPAIRAIFIEDIANKNYDYFYNKVENQNPIYLYNNYNSSTQYAVGEFCAVPIPSSGTFVYKCIVPSVGVNPTTSTTNWILHKENIYLNNQSEYNSAFEYIIHVPASVAFNPLLMRQQVNQYNLAGKRYLIQTF